MTEIIGNTRGQSAILQSEVEDLEQELRSVRKRERRHFAWALTGVSPAALLFAIGLLLHGNYGLLIPLFLLVSFSQFILGVKASGERARLAKKLADLLKDP